METSDKNKQQVKKSFLNGFLIGLGVTAFLTASTSIIIYQYVKLKREQVEYDERLYNYSSEGEISPDSGLATSDDPMFKSQSDQMEKAYEESEKELEDMKKATRYYGDKI